MLLDNIFRHRDQASVGGTVLFMLTLWCAWQYMPPPPLLVHHKEEVTINMEELPPLPRPPEPPRPETPPPPKPQAQPTPSPTPAPTAPMQKAEAPTPQPQPVAQPAPAQPVAKTEPQPAPPPPPAPAPAPKAVPPAAANERYIAELRGYLNSIKRYPTSREARQQRPTGTVKVWVLLDRAGQVVDAGVENSSEAMLLDREALRTVRTARFNAFPADAFAGESTHRFVVSLEYVLEGT
ncbi:TonB family protein [Uliginosibacterium sediminicola]|uniref:TonB family protein n=1 Tax=Uliginosibacterium sediminicola TaxID=2024550 RepID=A0ABU9YZW2_9RHOO